MTRHVEVQPVVRQRIARLGEQGERWLVGLPGVVADLERRWSITAERLLGRT
jgi:streptomycin 6-kinase